MRTPELEMPVHCDRPDRPCYLARAATAEADHPVGRRRPAETEVEPGDRQHRHEAADDQRDEEIVPRSWCRGWMRERASEDFGIDAPDDDDGDQRASDEDAANHQAGRQSKVPAGQNSSTPIMTSVTTSETRLCHATRVGSAALSE